MRITQTLGDIKSSGIDIFDFNYPFVAGHREEFELKFIDYYYDCEINYTTFGQFQRRLRSKLNSIMPYYMKLYESEFLVDSPFETYNIKESFNRKHDIDVFRKSLTYDEGGEKTKNRLAQNNDLKSNEKYTMTEEVINDGTLDRDTGFVETKDFHEVEKQNELTERDIKTTRELEQDISQHDSTRRSTDTATLEHKNSDKDVTSEQLTNTNETSTNNKTTSFSDTPQRNFATGDISSSYATDVTSERVDSTKNNIQNLNIVNKELTIDDIDSSVDVDENIEVDVTKNTIEKETTITDDDTDRERTTITDNNSTITNKGNQDDVTHSEGITNQNSNTDFLSNSITHQNYVGDKNAYSVGNEKQNKEEHGRIVYDKILSGRKMHSQSELLQAFRRTFINIDKMIIEECKILFLGIYK